MNTYLAFIDFIGKTIDDEYIYRFDFTQDTDTVWGDFFNIAPAVIIPDLQPEENTICKSARVKINKKLNLAKKNGCFSMQDCFDEIISLGFTELTEDDTIYYNDEPLRFDFGESYEEVEDKLKTCGYYFFDIIDKEIGDETIIDDLIESIDNEEKTVSEESTSSFTLVDEYVDFLTLKVGDKIKHETLNQILFDAGYEKIDYVHKEGQYTMRGYIVDIYSFKQAYPIRVSFFGDEIEKICKFDEYDQSEIETVSEITLYKVNNTEEDGTGEW